MSEKKFDIGIVVGRFQVNDLHPGHISLIESVSSRHKRVVLFLGVSPALVTRNNPLDFVTRKEMVLQRFPNLSVLSIPDMASDMDWSRELDHRIREACPVGSVLLYGGRASFISSYHGIFETADLSQIVSPVSGTDIRKEVSQEVKASSDFRSGVIFAAYNQYPKVYPTVDVAIVDGNRVLLGRKPHQEKFRFIGGFADPEDACYEDAAKREAAEETGLEIGEVNYIGSARIDDWRYRSERDKIMTLFFKANYVFGKPEAKDDIAELRWFDRAELTADKLVDEHHELLRLFLNQIN
jgi:bifunctional NMN adenylyltransferase/nudix hydrolase